MQEQRQRFRFRLPWPTGPAAAPPRAQPPQTQAAAQPAAAQTTQAPSQRPPFRPAGIAPIQPPPQAPPPPPRPATRSASPAPSPSRRPNARQAAPQSRAASTPSPAPPKASQDVPKPQTLSGLASTSTSSQPPPKQDISRPSPPPKAQPTSQETNQPLSQDPEPRSESLPETVVSSGNQSLKETIFPSNEVAPWSAEPAPSKPKKIDDGHISIDHSQLLSESDAKADEEPVKEEKTEDQSYYGHPIQKRITQLLTAAPGSGTRTKELRTVSFQAEQKQETLNSTNTVPSNSSDTKQVTTASSRFSKVTQTHTQPHQDPIIPNGERPPLHKEVRNDISKFVHKLAPGHINEPINEKPVSIVTLAGENRGASMQLGSDSAKKGGSVHIHRGYKMQPDDSPETSTDGEESLKGRSKDHMKKEDQAMTAFVNNNVQSINNSIVFDCNVAERNPGVQLVLSQSQAQPNKSNTAAEPPQTSKVKFRVTPAEKRTYQPTIRRRCLRGLLMEPSDSEPDNPEKPRRHGCPRYICGEKSKDKDIGIF